MDNNVIENNIQDNNKKGNKAVLIIIIVLVLICLGVGGYFLLNKDNKDTGTELKDNGSSNKEKPNNEEKYNDDEVIKNEDVLDSYNGKAEIGNVPEVLKFFGDITGFEYREYKDGSYVALINGGLCGNCDLITKLNEGLTDDYKILLALVNSEMVEKDIDFADTSESFQKAIEKQFPADLEYENLDYNEYMMYSDLDGIKKQVLYDDFLASYVKIFGNRNVNINKVDNGYIFPFNYYYDDKNELFHVVGCRCGGDSRKLHYIYVTNIEEKDNDYVISYYPFEASLNYKDGSYDDKDIVSYDITDFDFNNKEMFTITDIKNNRIDFDVFDKKGDYKKLSMHTVRIRKNNDGYILVNNK